MILLTGNTAIFHKFASGTFLEFDVINFHFAARCTHVVRLLLYAAHDKITLVRNQAPVYTIYIDTKLSSNANLLIKRTASQAVARAADMTEKEKSEKVKSKLAWWRKSPNHRLPVIKD